MMSRPAEQYYNAQQAGQQLGKNQQAGGGWKPKENWQIAMEQSSGGDPARMQQLLQQRMSRQHSTALPLAGLLQFT